ncbi:hypothetical protein [Salinilacihabitans rarus]|uniref:hypothetical protein n=1 Tax=Salinilacihabitans rarus TaxID=2961596 RepID=UPI0020C8C309|nr:hypothetical protein [Salinilacihabitans rarus]
MSQSDAVSKGVAVCDACGSMFAVEVSPDGSVRPIGVADCPCGEGELRQLG